MARFFCGNKGFTLVEMTAVSVIVAIVIMASSQATFLFLNSIKKSEKISEASSEAEDLILYLRRSAKNLTEDRIKKATTYQIVPRSTPIHLTANNNPIPALRISPQQWLLETQGHPHYSRVENLAGQASMDIFIDSFNLEEHGLRNDGGNLVKFTRRLLVSRCEELSRWVDMRDAGNKPQVSALYVIDMMKRRPFIGFNASGRPEIRCCPIAIPNCGDGQLEKYFFKTYAITFNDAGGVAGIEEFPKPALDNSVVGAGFGMYYENASGSNVTISSFTLINRCKILSLLSPSCKLQGAVSVMRAFGTDPSILKVNLRNISTTLSLEISKTGVIAL